MNEALPWIGVGALGAAGAYARYYLSARVTAQRPSTFPFGTLCVNLTGGIGLGLLTGLGVNGDAMLVLGAGFLGAYTTFSTWMVEAYRLAADERWMLAWLYLVGSMLAGLVATGGGWLAGGVLR